MSFLTVGSTGTFMEMLFGDEFISYGIRGTWGEYESLKSDTSHVLTRQFDAWIGMVKRTCTVLGVVYAAFFGPEPGQSPPELIGTLVDMYVSNGPVREPGKESQR